MFQLKSISELTESYWKRIGSLRLGNYTEFEKGTGFMEANGTAEAWDDLPPMFMAVSKPGVTAPTWAAFVGDIQLPTFAIGDYIYSSTEVTHGFKEGEGMQWHIHVITNGTEGVVKYVAFEIEYVLVNMNEAKAALTATVTEEFTIPANTPDRTHLYFDWVDAGHWIDGAGIAIGAQILCRLKRVTNPTHAGTDPATDPFVVALGVHAKVNTLGSREEHTK